MEVKEKVYEMEEVSKTVKDLTTFREISFVLNLLAFCFCVSSIFEIKMASVAFVFMTLAFLTRIKISDDLQKCVELQNEKLKELKNKKEEDVSFLR